jgi:hypothetical protein
VCRTGGNGNNGGPAPVRSELIQELNLAMDIDDFDDRSTYSLSPADESSSSEEEQEGLELPGAELRIEGDFKCATSFLHPFTLT